MAAYAPIAKGEDATDAQGTKQRSDAEEAEHRKHAARAANRQNAPCAADTENTARAADGKDAADTPDAEECCPGCRYSGAQDNEWYLCSAWCCASSLNPHIRSVLAEHAAQRVANSPSVTSFSTHSTNSGIRFSLPRAAVSSWPRSSATFALSRLARRSASFGRCGASIAGFTRSRSGCVLVRHRNWFTPTTTCSPLSTARWYW